MGAVTLFWARFGWMKRGTGLGAGPPEARDRERVAWRSPAPRGTGEGAEEGAETAASARAPQAQGESGHTETVA